MQHFDIDIYVEGIYIQYIIKITILRTLLLHIFCDRVTAREKRFECFWEERSREKEPFLFFSCLRPVSTIYIYIMLKETENDLYPSETRTPFSLSFKRYFKLEPETCQKKHASSFSEDLLVSRYKYFSLKKLNLILSTICRLTVGWSFCNYDI